MEKMQASHRIAAVLGPTNTGKTYLAVERMLGHASGVIGCPLRLLAREIYEKIVSARGAGAVALVTGEEKIVPRRPHYYVCTTEAMPRDLSVEFAAIDEIQLAADPERGHVFTDRILHTRGLSETMFVGAATMKPLLKFLVPGIEFVSRPRFSNLNYAGERKITRLQSRSAVVAFAASDVYMLAESIRRLRGGTAVVLGALSPRTRNAQVGMFQAGEVDYLVATDAIGMGLNLDVNHVAFAELRKFDGRKPRSLTAPEIAQIAGRAGRHMRDGTFGTTADVGSLHPDIVAAVEQHTFPTLTKIYWRNIQLDFKSIENLLRSLELEPPSPQLIRPRDAEDVTSLRALIENPDILARANGHQAISLLWEVCSIPDFRKMFADEHIKLLTTMYLHLSGPNSCLPSDWVHKMASHLDQTEGDIDTLAARIAHIRTWNYVGHRQDWVENPLELQERTRAIEDNLSDALHERLTQRFVDRRAAVLVKGFKQQNDTPIRIQSGGELIIGDELLGRLQGLNFIPSDTGECPTGAIRRAIRHILAPHIQVQARALEAGRDEDFELASSSTIIWDGAPVGHLLRGPSSLEPRVTPITGEMVDGHMRSLVRRRLEKWITSHIREHFAPLLNARDAQVTGSVRGIAFQLLEGFGNTERRHSDTLINILSETDRKSLARLGIRLGKINLFMPAMLKTKAIALRDQLWRVHHNAIQVSPPPSGRVSLQIATELPASYYSAIGYQPAGSLAVRVDILERLAAALRRRARQGPFSPSGELRSLCGAQPDDFTGILRSLGYQLATVNNEMQNQKRSDKVSLYIHAPKQSKHRKGRPKEKTNARLSFLDPGASPFEALRSLDLRNK